MKKLLVIEDEASIRESLVDFLTMRDFLVAACESAEAAWEELESADFAMILLDLMLPGEDGLSFLKRLRKKGDRTPVIVLTARGEEKQRVLGLELGADDYLVKPFSVFELAARMEAIWRRTGAPASSVAIGDALVDLEGHEVVRDGRTERLIQKEAELLAFFLRNPGKTFRRGEILSEVWGYDETPTTRTVDTHVFQLRKKIEVQSEKPRHFVTVHGVGYRFVP